jgi:hypothetical protein
MNGLKDASTAVNAAWVAGVSGNALAADLPAFQRMKEIEKELGVLMLTVMKLRGL